MHIPAAGTGQVWSRTLASCVSVSMLDVVDYIPEGSSCSCSCSCNIRGAVALGDLQSDACPGCVGQEMFFRCAGQCCHSLSPELSVRIPQGFILLQLGEVKRGLKAYRASGATMDDYQRHIMFVQACMRPASCIMTSPTRVRLIIRIMHSAALCLGY